MALSISERVPRRTLRSLRKETAKPIQRTVLPTKETPSFPTSDSQRLRLIDWTTELKQSERDPEGIDFPTFDPNLD